MVFCFFVFLGPEDWFASRTNNHRNVIRAISYPAQKTPPAPGQVSRRGA